jgi:signal transduction histidine kinase
VGLVALQDGQTVELRIIDEGPGIAEAERELIFEKHARIAPDLNTPISAGHGLGLTFCRLAVGGHGGSIRVEPNQPHGCVFVVRLPRGRSAPSALGAPVSQRH